MADLAQINWKDKGAEVKLRALLEDLIEYHKGVYPNNRLALLVWFNKSSSEAEQNLLELFSGLAMNRIVGPTRVSLLWRTGAEEPPFANIYATSVSYFEDQLNSDPGQVANYLERAEVLFFDKRLLKETILRAFRVTTEPSGLLKGWYVTPEEFAKSKTIQQLLSSHSHTRPEIGLVKIEESPDFENCRGLLHAEIGQRWLPLSQGGLSNYVFYRDALSSQPGYLLFEGGSLYRIQKFEVKTAPEYSERVLEKPRDDRYPEVYLRAVRPSEHSAA